MPGTAPALLQQLKRRRLSGTVEDLVRWARLVGRLYDALARQRQREVVAALQVIAGAVPGATVTKAGPNTCPDLAVYRKDACEAVTRDMLRTDSARIVAVEVKKLKRVKNGPVARATGGDFNSTPPCGTVRIYDEDDKPLDIRAFYLFVCQETHASKPGTYFLSALVLCDGDVLNANFDFYLETVQPRAKATQLGSYGDGAVRNRPMIIFPNPLGSPALNRQVTLIHAVPTLESAELRLIGQIHRTMLDGSTREFWCYRASLDVADPAAPTIWKDPFPTPKKPKMGSRGKMRVKLSPK